tara:strand:+ start:1607 stop:1789 length:183 start_codon:yes stop_codon:yes gene_type:complete
MQPINKESMKLNLELKILLISSKINKRILFYFKAINRTPNISVEAIKPTPIKVEIIPVFK